jgi:serine/threonine-protein kinase
VTDIPNYETFAKIEPLDKGWSSDKKYYIETRDGKHRLLRVADISEYERKRAEFDMLGRVAELGVPASRPVDFGTCDGGKSVYQLLTWIDGEDAETILPTRSAAEQYAFGVKAGKLLRKMQSLQPFAPSMKWADIFGANLNRYISAYNACGYTFGSADNTICYIEENRHLLNNRPMCFSHDDYHCGNMIIAPSGELFIIDFQRFRPTEPYHALCGTVFDGDRCPPFATGLVDGYFPDTPPQEFWRVYALYMAAISVNSLPYALSLKDHENTTLQAELDFAYRQCANIARWFDNFNRVVPTWYLQPQADN